MILFDLSQDRMTRLEKVAWHLERKETLLESIPSHSTRMFMGKVEQLLLEMGIRWEYTPLCESTYVDWLGFYQKKVAEKHFDLLASADWYQKTIAKGRTVEGLMFYHQEQLVGSLIISRDANQLASVAFEISEEMPLIHHGSLGLAVEYMYLKTMWEQGVKVISGGRSRNAFGVINSLGYLRFKTSIYTPVVPDEPVWLETVPVEPEKPVLWYGMKDQAFCLGVIGMDKQEVTSRFHTGSVPVVIPPVRHMQ